MITVMRVDIRTHERGAVEVQLPEGAKFLGIHRDNPYFVLSFLVDDTAPYGTDTLALVEASQDLSEVGDVVYLGMGHEDPDHLDFPETVYFFLVVTDDPDEQAPQRRVTHPGLLKDGWGPSTPTDIAQLNELDTEPEKEP